MGFSKPYFMMVRVLMAALFVAVCLFAAGGAIAADEDDPTRGRSDIFIKDSALVIAPYRLDVYHEFDSRAMIVTFDQAQGSQVSNSSIKFKKSVDFPRDHDVEAYGIPAVLGKIRGEDGSLSVALGDYGPGGASTVTISKFSLAGKLSGKRILFRHDWFNRYASDIVAMDINGDGVEDYIVAEAALSEERKDGRDLYLRFIDGVTGENYEKLLAQVHGEEAHARIDVGYFDGPEGEPMLALSYVQIVKEDKWGEYRLVIYGGLKELLAGDASPLKDFEITNKKICDSNDQANANGHDLAVGDYDGDGIDEVIAVADENGGNKQALMYMKRTAKGWDVKNAPVGHSTTNTNYDQGLAVAADLDNCGRDEFIWMLPKGAENVIVGVALLESGTLKNVYSENYDANFSDYSLRRTASMTAGSFTGRKAVDTLSGTAAGEVLLLRRGWKSGHMDDLVLTVLDTVIGGNGRVSGLTSRGDEITYLPEEFNHKTPIILSGNLLGESVRVGKGVNVEDSVTTLPTTVVQMPPKHADYIPIPWETTDYTFLPPEQQKPDMLNATTYDAFYTSWTRDKVETTNGSTAFKTDSGFTTTSSKTTEGIISRTEAETKARKYAEENSSYEKASVSESQKLQANTDDRVTLVTHSQKIWSYELIGEKVKSGDKYVPGLFQIAVPTARDSFAAYPGTEVPDYRPVHENFNALSYPASLNELPDYDPQKTVTGLMNGTIQPDVTASYFSWTQGTGEAMALDSSLSHESSKSISISRSNKKGTTKRTRSKSSGETYFEDTASTNSASWDTGVSLTLNYGRAVEQQGNMRNRVRHEYSAQAYMLPNGALAASYAVTLPTNTPNTLWGSDKSTYYLLPDPALNLPGKFTADASSTVSDYTLMVPNTDPLLALKIRGLRVTDENGDEFNLSPGTIPRDAEGGAFLEFPVYNYSTNKNADSVDVRVSLAKIPSRSNNLDLQFFYPEDGDIVASQTVTVGPISHHLEVPISTDKPNWVTARVSFDFAMLEESHLRLFVELDPDDKIVETHERWDYMYRDENGIWKVKDKGGDPGGNNLGYYDVALCDIEGYFEASSASRSVAGGTVAAASDESVKIHVDWGDTPDLSAAAIREAIAERRDIPVELNVYYDEGPDFIPGFQVAVSILQDDEATAHGVRIISIPGLKKGERYPVNASLRNLLLASLANKAGKLRFHVVGDAFGIDTTNLSSRALDFFTESQEETQGDSGSSGCSGQASGGIAGLLLLAAYAAIRQLPLRIRRR